MCGNCVDVCRRTGLGYRWIECVIVLIEHYQADVTSQYGTIVYMSFPKHFRLSVYTSHYVCALIGPVQLPWLCVQIVTIEPPNVRMCVLLLPLIHVDCSSRALTPLPWLLHELQL